jgi:hypothetical protein
LQFTVTNTGVTQVAFSGTKNIAFTLLTGDADDAVTSVTFDKFTGGPALNSGDSMTFDLLVQTSPSHGAEVPTDASTWQVGVDVRFTDENGPNLQHGTGQVLVPDAQQPVDTPEPATITLLGIGIVGMAGYGWRRRCRV